MLELPLAPSLDDTAKLKIALYEVILQLPSKPSSKLYRRSEEFLRVFGVSHHRKPNIFGRTRDVGCLKCRVLGVVAAAAAQPVVSLIGQGFLH